MNARGKLLGLFTSRARPVKRAGNVPAGITSRSRSHRNRIKSMPAPLASSRMRGAGPGAVGPRMTQAGPPRMPVPSASSRIPGRSAPIIAGPNNAGRNIATGRFATKRAVGSATGGAHLPLRPDDLGKSSGGWWSQQSGMRKAGMIGAGVVIGGGIMTD